MAGDLPLSDTEIRVIESLVRHRVRFLIVGLSAAALQGAPVVTEDVDLWFEELGNQKMVNALRAVGAGYVPPFGLNPPMLAGEGTELFDIVIRMDGLGPFSEEAKKAMTIRLGKLRVKVLPLERVLKSKEAANRAKDQLVVPVLRNVLKTVQARVSAGKNPGPG